MSEVLQVYSIPVVLDMVKYSLALANAFYLGRRIVENIWLKRTGKIIIIAHIL